MENYIVSARKYRPSTFESVVGQRALTTTLKNAIATQKLAHAYLFCGPRGVGKTTCARIFAKTINCMNLTADGEACNECESCVAFNEQRSYNIHELDAASNNSVDDIRQLVEQGMFVGSVADNFGERIEQKIFHCEIVVDAGKIAEEEKAYRKIPVITGFVDDDGVDHMKEMVQENYNRIKEDVKRIVADELERIASDPALKHLLELNK